MKQHLIFALIIVGLVAALGVMVYTQERVVSNGAVVILETRPVDPRDLFRGEYVVLNYAIERDEKVTKVAQSLPNRAPIYIKLSPGSNNVAEVTEVGEREPDYSEGIWLEGEVERGRVQFPDLAQYYVPEGAGRPIERMRSGLKVEVSIYEGEGRVVRLLDSEFQPIDPEDYIE